MDKEIYIDIKEHLVKDKAPSLYLNSIRESLKGTAFEDLYQLSFVEQEKKYHPEGVVWNHVMMVVDNAARVREYANNKEFFMIAALFHDIGKYKTTKRNKQGRLISYNHDTIGGEILSNILEKCEVPKEEKEAITNLVKFHMHHLYIMKNLPFGNINEMIKNTDIKDMVLLFLCDRLGRGEKHSDINIEEIEDIKSIINILKDKFGVDTVGLATIIEEIEKDYKK